MSTAKKRKSKPSAAKKRNPKDSPQKKQDTKKKPSGEKQDAEGERKADGCSAKPPAGKSKRLRIYPNAEQRNTLLAWMGVVRWTYNQAVDAIRKNPELKTNAKKLRALFVTNAAVRRMRAQQPDKDFSWILKTPSFPRNEAIADVLFAYKSNRAKQVKQGNRFAFRVGFRSRKEDPQQCIKFSSSA